MRTLLKAGIGRRDITPPLGTLLMGYPDPYGERKAERVRDPLQATALVFESGPNQAALVSLDVTVIEDRTVAVMRRRIAEKTGIPAGHVTVCSIQTHSGPRTQEVWGWSDLDLEFIEKTMVPGAVEATVEAFAGRVPVRVGIGVANSSVGVNRRMIDANHEVRLKQNKWAVIDPIMTVLRFQSGAGPLANLVHYGAHPTVLGSKSKVISRDWPGLMVDRMEQLTGARTVYINGAVGDVAPRSNSGSAVGDGETALWEVGCRAALDAMETWRSIKDMRDLELHCLVDAFELPYRPLPEKEKAVKELSEAEGKKDVPGEGMCQYSYWRAVLEEEEGAVKTGKPYTQVITALGPVAIIPFPGEPFAETVLRLRELSPFQYTLCNSTSCGNNGYFPTRESLHRGGYETWVGRAMGAYLLADNIDDILVEENLKLLKALHEKTVPPLG